MLAHDVEVLRAEERIDNHHDESTTDDVLTIDDGATAEC